MKYLDELDLYYKFNTSILGTSPILNVAEVTNKIDSYTIGNYGLISKEFTSKEFIDSSHFEKESERLVKDLMSGKCSFNYFKKRRKELVKGAKVLKSFWKKNKDKIQTFSDEKFLEVFFRFMKEYTYFYGLGAITFVYEAYLANKLSNEHSEYVINYIEHRTKYKSFMLEYEDLALEYYNTKNKKIKKRIFDNYFYIKTGFHDSKVLTEKQIVKDGKSHTKKKESKKIKENDMRQFLKNLSKRERTILELLALTLPLRDLRKKNNLLGGYIMFRFVDEALRRKKLVKKRKLFLRMYYFEMNELMKNPDKLLKKLKARKTVTQYIDKKGKKHYLDGVHIKERKLKEKKLTGVIASKGKAKGIVKIVTQLSEFKKVKKGDILVAIMTMPEYLPIMKKAIAIVTEEGGITSHSAIVSRELGIPCIVGVTGITSILKDGDLIEVDANKGVVRKIE